LIFEPFKRASNTEGVKGTGLGLPIVKKSVEKIGGKIWVKSEQGKGSKFKVELPLAASYF
jgi:signal transduction histidine kinase